MNCEGFKDVIYEYLEDSLSLAVQVEAREHLRQCAACQRALQREEALAEGLQNAIQRATEGLRLRSGTLSNVLRPARSQQPRPNAFLQAWQWFISNSLRPAGAVAALLLALIVLLRLPSHHGPGMSFNSELAEANTCVVDVPMQTETRLFHQQDNLVTDAIASSVAVAHARFRASQP